MNELIPITPRPVNGATVQTVSARELHAFLQVGRDFSTWIKDRISKYGFEEGRDFVTFDDLTSPISGSPKARPQPTIEYALSLDMAKELCMVENNDQGKRARRYFIECERRLKTTTAFDPDRVLADILQRPGDLLQLAAHHAAARLEAEKRASELEGAIEEMAPKVDAYRRLTESEGSLCITDAAKSLKVKPQRLFKHLRENGWIYRRSGTTQDVAYQARIVTGLLEHRVHTIVREDGSEKVVSQVRVTPKGLARLQAAFPPADSGQGDAAVDGAGGVE